LDTGSLWHVVFFGFAVTRHPSASSAFTVSASRLEQVRRHIASQQAHHRKASYQEEVLALLRKHGMGANVRDLAG
jgi:hypothetical protein